jgi:hypothetical protein
MARIYENKEKELHTLLSKAANDSGGTVFIPDLQRPYVWAPRQVVLPIDSLLRGWPIQSLPLALGGDSLGFKLSKEVRPLTYTNPIRKHLTAEGHRLFAEQLLPKIISALGGSHAG